MKLFFLIEMLFVSLLPGNPVSATNSIAVVSLQSPTTDSSPLTDLSQTASSPQSVSSSLVNPLPPTDSMPLVDAYRQLLDSAARYEQERYYQEAATYYAKGFDAYKDYYVNRLQIINRKMANTYQVEKKEQELEQLHRTLLLRKKQTVLFSILLAGLFAALVLFFFLQKYRLRMVGQRRRQKENETARLKLEKESKEIEVQINTLQAQKTQKELMTETLLVEYKNNVLEELSLFFANHVALNKYKDELQKIMHAEIEPAFETSTALEASALETSTFENLQQIHPEFCERLQKQANDKLTTLDLKYCRMVYLKMSSKEMADILQVTPHTIRVNKYRLKQKLGLKKEDDLGRFMETMG